MIKDIIIFRLKQTGISIALKPQNHQTQFMMIFVEKFISDSRTISRIKVQNIGTKITKRYITTYGRLRSKLLLQMLPTIYVEYPTIRPNLLFYLSQIGYSKKASSTVIQILKTIDIFDDLSLYQLCFLVTQWEIPINSDAKKFLKEFEA